MPIVDRYRKDLRAERARRAISTRRLIWLHRPIWLHDRATRPGKCDCCNSHNAHRVREIEHLDVLIDRETGDRWVRTQVEDTALFDRLAAQAERVDMPIRCSPKQLEIILDRTHRIIGVFGGERGGKSTIEAEWFVDRWLERGGRGAKFWWVSKTRKKALGVGLAKLVKGERADRWVPGILPPQVIVSYPRSIQHDIPLLLVDGTEIWFHHASTPDGDNLKGEPPVAVVLDEGCTVDHESNWSQLKMRITDANGQLLTATTPVIGHYLQREIRQKGKSYEELEQLEPAERAKVETVWTSLSQPENPWLDEDSVRKNIETFNGDDLKIRAHIYGEWVAIGRQLWRHFDEPTHLRDGPWRDVGGWGLENITRMAAAKFFRGTESALDMIAGQDFNIDPNNLVIAQIGVPKGMDPANRRNWIVFILDHIQAKGTVTEFATFMSGEAAGKRKLPSNYFAKLAIACDPSGAHKNQHKSHGLRGGTSLANEMRRYGFDCRPCNTSLAGEATQPSQIDSISLLHKLMSDRVEAPDGVVWPRFVVHATRCPELVYSLQTQIATPRGGIEKRSSTKSDVLSGPTDAARYLCWAIPGSAPEYKSDKPRFSSFAA